MNSNGHAELGRVAVQLADRAREVVLERLGAGFRVERKGDGSPVTEVDLAVETALREVLADLRPKDGILGEEYGGDASEHELCWVLDPIDGTRAFAAGIPTFVTLIGLLENGTPRLGVIEQPISRHRWIGAGGETHFNGERATTRACASLADAIAASTAPQFVRGEWRPRFERLESEVRDVQWGGDGYLYGALASGGLDLVVESGLALHDYCALAPVVEGAGGRITDWSGQPLYASSGGDVLAAGDAELHARALDFLA